MGGSGNLQSPGPALYGGPVSRTLALLCCPALASEFQAPMWMDWGTVVRFPASGFASRVLQAQESTWSPGQPPPQTAPTPC